MSGRHNLAALAAGLLFGLGLIVSQMANPAKVLAFLDVAGDWDPSLALVMAAALAVALPAYRLALKMEAPLLEGSFNIPQRRTIDAPLLGGAVLFGLGWGLAGFCPGPAIVAFPLAPVDTGLFFAGMCGAILFMRRARSGATAQAAGDA